MVERDTPWEPGTPCWVDLGVDDVETARQFYTTVFGWEIPDGDEQMGGYAVITKDGKDVGGIAPKQMPEQPTAWTTYIASTDADATCEKIKAAGGHVFAEPMDVAEYGRMAFGVDPGGAFFGVWQAGTTTGFQVANEPGSPTWNENMSRSFEANKAFYAAVFGYTWDDMSSDEFKYAVAQVDGRGVAGVGEMGGDIPAEVPANWLTYFAVDDCDATVDTVIKAGGALRMPAMDSPYGRFAIVSDPEGATFAVMKNATPA